MLTRAFATSPAKLIATKGRGATCWVYAATFGGGLVGGDDIQLTRGRHSRRARAADDAGVDEGVPIGAPFEAKPDGDRRREDALLAVVPDPMVCFAGADFAQTQRYDLHADASLVLVDWMTSGRHAAGERWAFSRYESRLDIRRRRPTESFSDAVVLEPSLDSVADTHGPLRRVPDGDRQRAARRRCARAELVSEVSGSAPVARGADLVVPAATLRDGGALLRMAGASVEAAGAHAARPLAFLSPLVGDDLWSRKW